MNKKVLIIGGGASGFFTAINAKEQFPDLDVTILEKGKEVLKKVKISGGGRCNVTHACFEPKDLTTFYPRGEKELLGPFHQFMTGDVMEWFENNGVPIKIEDDGRAFPKANTSQAIIDCFLYLTKKLGINIITNCRVTDFYKKDNLWSVCTKNNLFTANKLIIACGSDKKIWSITNKLGHKVIQPVPSLFTFKIKDKILNELAGITVPKATITIKDTTLKSSGNLLITHWGLSGPAILKLSSFGARVLAMKKYHYKIAVNWLSIPYEAVFKNIQQYKTENSKKKIAVSSPFKEIPKRLWEGLLNISELNNEKNWADLNKVQMQNIAKQLTHCVLQANGKSTFKEEFVTAGGIDLKEINFKTYESKICSNLYFVGEVLNIDAITGGFNFQNAWTSGFICAKNLK